MTAPTDYKKEFLQLAMDLGVLKFGEFTLKSGRTSPYFFNAGLFNSGRSLARLGSYYARALVESGIEFDMLFGPAYKGIPLAAVTAAALALEHQLDVPYAFDRKEVKDHGEGGKIVGAPLQGRVVIIDDVITAGTAIGEAIATIRAHDATACAALIALNRQERGKGQLSAIQEVSEKYELNVVSLVEMSDLIRLIENSQDADLTPFLAAMQQYRLEFGEKIT